MTEAIAKGVADIDPMPVSDLAAVEAVVRRRYRAAEQGDPAALADVLHPVWTAKRAIAGDQSEVETRAAVLARTSATGRRIAAAPDVTSVQMCFGDFAIVRTDEWSPPSTCIHLLFKERGTWRIAGEAGVAASDGLRDPQFTPRAEEAAVLDVLAGYYRAVTTADADIIRRSFAPFWQMKNHQDGVVAAEEKPSFVERIARRPLPGYWDDRQIADVQIVADRLAYVRVDKPSGPSTTVFLFMKTAGAWSIIDKAWSARKPA